MYRTAVSAASTSRPTWGKTAQTSDALITPGNSEGGGVTLNTKGKLLGIGPDRIEFDNPIYHGNSGGPVFDTRTNQVVGVVTGAMKVDTSNELDKASMASRNSAIGGPMRYFGMRLDNVPKWVDIDWARFQAETAMIDSFHQRTKCLDSFINGPSKEANIEEGMWKTDEKIKRANENFLHQAPPDTDKNQRLARVREMLADLVDIADIDLTKMQDTKSLYSFDVTRAKDEVEYRQEIKKELDSVNVSHLSDEIEKEAAAANGH